ncbi:MAG: hydantoinase [Desulfobacteraceae bacterium IS3]|nr:MAG: hydantoinase [Desulfobacteraceae bacterium IS3]
MIIGLDVGGTHTDAVLLGDEGLIREVKVFTDADDLFATVLTGLEKITEGIPPEKITRAVLSTTLTTNAVIQKKIPEVGMIVSSGPGIDPEFFRTNEHFFAVSGSIDHRGREVSPVDKTEVLHVAEMLKEKGIRNVGIVGKFSCRNPSHELKIYNLIKNSFGKIFLGHRVSGNLNFPRRIATTYLNTAVRQLHKKFFEAVIKSLEKKGLSIPIYVLKADGGTMSVDASLDFPSQTILSGPAASVMGAIAFVSEEDDTVVLDIGGTTTDIAILVNRVPLLEPLGIELGNYKTLIRSLQTCSIGIGGDSAVRVTDGKLTVGPDRAGRAMAYGGAAPTPTDALFVLGKIKNGDREKAVKGIEIIAKSLDKSIEDTAFQIFDIACREILAAIRKMVNAVNSKPVYTIYELREGYVVKPKQVLIIGGPAPYFARRLEELSDFKVGVVPRWGVANAIGAALARTTCEVSLFADTEQRIATAPEENFRESVSQNFSKKDALAKAYQLLKKKALQTGEKNADALETEVLEELEFNMIRGFSTIGKNIRVKVQVKPGLIYDPDVVAEKLLEGV